MAGRHQHKWLNLWRYTRSLLLGIPAGEGPPGIYGANYHQAGMNRGHCPRARSRANCET